MKFQIRSRSPRRRSSMVSGRRILQGCLAGLVSSVLLLAQTQVPAEALPPKDVLPEGTPVRMRTNRTISSADAHVNDTVDFETLDDVKVGDVVVIPKGSTALATVTEAVPKRRLARGGKLGVNVDYVRLGSGEKLALRGVQEVKGGGHAGIMTGAMVATGIVFFPAAPLFLFMKGKDITIPKGHELTVYTSTDYDLAKLRALPAKAPVDLQASLPASETLTNADVLKLATAGLSEQLLVAKIASSRSVFSVSVDDLVELKKQGLTDAVIGAMIQASRH